MVDGDPAGPDLVEQFLLGHHLAYVAQQHRKYLQWLVLDVDGQSCNTQFVASLVELDGAETPAIEPDVG